MCVFQVWGHYQMPGSVLHIILAVPRIEFFRRETSDAVLGICWIHSSTLWSEIQIMSQDEMINLYIGQLSTCDCDKNPWSEQWCSWDQEKSTATTQALITKCKVLLKTSDYEEIPRLQQQNQQQHWSWEECSVSKTHQGLNPLVQLQTFYSTSQFLWATKTCSGNWADYITTHMCVFSKGFMPVMWLQFWDIPLGGGVASFYQNKNKQKKTPELEKKTSWRVQS